MQPAPGISTPNVEALSEVIGFLTEGVAIFDADARLCLVNSSFCTMYPGLSDILRPGMPWNIFLHEAVNRGVIPQSIGQRLDAIEAGLVDTSSLPDILQISSGKRMVFSLQLKQSSEGGFVLRQSECIDQTSDADAARDLEILLRKVLEACPTSLIMSRVADGQVIYRSPAATDLLGTAKSSFTHFAHREDRADFVTLLLPDARVDHMRITCLRPDGSAFPAEISARLIDYRGEDVIVANIEDLTDELAIQSKLGRQKEQLFQSEKLSALGELLASVAHELNNPLSIIVGNAEILREELEETGLERRVEKLNNAAHRCIRIVRSFLSLARQEPLNLITVDPAKLIDTAIDAVNAEAEKANIQLSVAPNLDIAPVTADEVQLTQVIINLLTNAVQAIQHADIGDRITVSCSLQKNTICLRVSDNGPGISDDIKTRIFDPLFTTKDIGQGTGVGLAYSHRIIAAHKGQIRLENTNTQGASFIIELPLASLSQELS